MARLFIAYPVTSVLHEKSFKRNQWTESSLRGRQLVGAWLKLGKGAVEWEKFIGFEWGEVL